MMVDSTIYLILLGRGLGDEECRWDYDELVVDPLQDIDLVEREMREAQARFMSSFSDPL